MHALRGVSLDMRRRRVRHHRRAIGLRQVHLHAHPRLPRSPDERDVRARRTRRLEAVARRAGPRAEREDRVRLPELQPAAADVGDRERRAADALQPSRQSAGGAAGAGDGGARVGRSRRSGRAPSQSAVGRPAAARGDRARADDRAADPAGRRADRQPRHADEHRGDGDLPAAAQRARHHRDPDHPRAADRASTARGSSASVDGRIVSDTVNKQLADGERRARLRSPVAKASDVPVGELRAGRCKRWAATALRSASRCSASRSVSAPC